MNRSMFPIAVGAAAILVIGILLSCVYTIKQTEQVLVVQFGQPLGIVSDPGLHFKLPWQSLEVMERRLLNLDAPSEEVIAQDKKRLVVDAFARWRITDPLRFYQSLYDEDGARRRLMPILSSNIRRVIGSHNFSAMLSDARAKLMIQIRDNVNNEAKNLGLVVVDVRIRHADLPQQNSQAIYNRMKQERVREANEFRAEGEEASQGIRASAEREVTVLLAEATQKSEILRGEGDAEKTRILGEAFGRDPKFFAFYRSMQAYQEALPGDNTTILLSPDSEFLRDFQRGGQ
jgi:membrane protease subunit HflC